MSKTLHPLRAEMMVSLYIVASTLLIPVGRKINCPSFISLDVMKFIQQKSAERRKGLAHNFTDHYSRKVKMAGTIVAHTMAMVKSSEKLVQTWLVPTF